MCADAPQNLLARSGGAKSKGARGRTGTLRALVPLVLLAAVFAAAVLLIEAARPPADGAAAAPGRADAPFDGLRANGAEATAGGVGPATLRANAARGVFPCLVALPDGGELLLARRPARIVSQTLASDEVLLELCPGPPLIALSKEAVNPRYSNCVAAARTRALPRVAQAEEMLALQPDLVVTAAYSDPAVTEVLERAQARVLRLAAPESLADVRAHLRVLGQAAGVPGAADVLIAAFDARLAAARARVPPGSALRVLSYDPPSGYTAGAATMFDEILTLLSARNVAAEQGLTGFARIGAEQIVAWDPDRLLIGADPDTAAAWRARLLEHPALAAGPLADPARLLTVEDRLLLAASHHVAALVEWLAAQLYPE